MVEGYRELESVYRWMRRLEKTLPGLPERYFGRAADAMEYRAKQIVDQTVYDVYFPLVYRRTRALFNAVSVIPLIDEAGVEVGIHDSPELRVPLGDQVRADYGGGFDLSGYIYPALMLPEAVGAFGGHPYWRDSDRAKPTASLPRDFFGAWFREFYETAFNGLDQALAEEIA
ncbi:MAG: hypothetical protein ABIH03_14825 [Pseudomonadota bacterium]